jgi:hypothetical protein
MAMPIWKRNRRRARPRPSRIARPHPQDHALLTTPRMAVDADTEHRLARRAEVQPIPLHAGRDPFDIGNLRLAQPHHVGRAGLLHFLRPPVLRVRAGERTGEHRNQNSGGKHSRPTRQRDAACLEKLWCSAPTRLCHLRPPVTRHDRTHPTPGARPKAQPASDRVPLPPAQPKNYYADATLRRHFPGLCWPPIPA